MTNLVAASSGCFPIIKPIPRSLNNACQFNLPEFPARANRRLGLHRRALAEDLVERGADVRVITGVPHYPQWHIYNGYGKSCIEISDQLTVARRRHSVPTNPQLVNRLGMELSFGLNAVIARCNTPDVVVLVSPALISSILVALKAALQRRPMVVWVQDIYSLAISQTGHGGSLRSRLLPGQKDRC
jgi:colanic acid biosynthesis glycosyl transferase WcaI